MWSPIPGKAKVKGLQDPPNQARTHQTGQEIQPDQALGFRTGCKPCGLGRAQPGIVPKGADAQNTTEAHFLQGDTSLSGPHAWLLCMEMMSLLDSLLQHMAQTKIPGCLTASQSKWDSGQLESLT